MNGNASWEFPKLSRSVAAYGLGQDSYESPLSAFSGLNLTGRVPPDPRLKRVPQEGEPDSWRLCLPFRLETQFRGTST